MASIKEELGKKIWYSFLFVIFFGIVLYLPSFHSLFADIFNLKEILNSLREIFPKIIILIGVFFLFKLINLFVIDYFIGRSMEVFQTRSRIKSIKKVIHFFWWTLYILIVLSILMGDLGTFLASLGLVGLGLTFALQKPILNFVGWITIILKDIYNEGDRIKIGTVRGDVKEIQMMNTVLYSLLDNSDVRSHKIITIPNEFVLTQEVENFTKDSNYITTSLRISITYESNLKKAMDLLEEIMKNHLQENIGDYKKWEKRKGSLKKIIDSLRLKENKNSGTTAIELDKETIKLQEDFLPNLRIELADSSVDLIAQFLTPYTKARISKTYISREFLERSKKEKDITIAYPHLEVIYHDKKKS